MAGFVRIKPAYDLLVIGGGHAGLQAGLKAGLLHQSALILDRGPKYGRSYYAPQIMNIPGFPGGISGHMLLDLQIEQVRGVSAWTSYLSPVAVEGVVRRDDGYEVTFERLRTRHTVKGRTLLLALGVVDRIPEVGGKIDPIFPWANQGIVDFCILCDGHKLTGHTVAVLGHGTFAARTALDLLHFRPASVTLLLHGRPFLEGAPGEERSTIEQALREHGIAVLPQEVVGFDGIREKHFDVVFADGSRASFDKGFSGLGWYSTHLEIPRSLGARISAEEYVATDDDGRVLAADGSGPIPGLYAAGDLRDGWKQVPEAWATAERAVIHAFAYYLDVAEGPRTLEP